MPLETGTRIEDLVPSNPLGTDPKAQGDDHIRLIKACVQGSLPNLGPDALKLSAASLNAMIGMVGAFAAAPLAGDWLLCDGSAVSRTTYADLFALLGVAYGNGDGSTTFNLPDYRGEFLRGTDAGAGNDPDALSRTDRGDGTTGDTVGTKQDHEFAQHNHPTTDSVAALVGGGGALIGGSTHQNLSQATEDRGGNETRPRNVNVLYYILAK